MGQGPEDDELDALMAEQPSDQRATAPVTNPSHSAVQKPGDEADFADEEEVLAGMDGMW